MARGGGGGTAYQGVWSDGTGEWGGEGGEKEEESGRRGGEIGRCGVGIEGEGGKSEGVAWGTGGGRRAGD